MDEKGMESWTESVQERQKHWESSRWPSEDGLEQEREVAKSTKVKGKTLPVILTFSSPHRTPTDGGLKGRAKPDDAALRSPLPSYPRRYPTAYLTWATYVILILEASKSDHTTESTPVSNHGNGRTRDLEHAGCRSRSNNHKEGKTATFPHEGEVRSWRVVLEFGLIPSSWDGTYASRHQQTEFGLDSASASGNLN